MNSPQISRRRFVQAVALVGTTTLLGTRLTAQAPMSGPMTARQLVDLIKRKMVANWNEDSYRDTFKCGNPDTVIKGVASTFMSTLDVLRRANQAGLNFVITHEPTFWSDPDTITDHVFDDPLYQHKKDFIEKNNMVVWRSHDHWHLFLPEPMAAGLAKTAGWEKCLTEPGGRTFRMPPTSVRDLAKQMAAKFETRSVRIIGDPNLMVTKLGRSGRALAQIATALATDVDAVITSDAREVDVIEYARDLVVSGTKKAIILVSHQTAEEAGMTEFVPWLQALVPGMKVENIKTHDQLWIG